MITIEKMDALVEKGKKPEVKANSYEFDKLEREFCTLEDDLKTYGEVIEGLYATVDENNRLANIETIKHALDISKRFRSKSFEQAIELVNQIQLERNLAEEEKVKFIELSQQFRDGAPTKVVRRSSSFAERIEQGRVDDLKESVEDNNRMEQLISQKEEV